MEKFSSKLIIFLVIFFVLILDHHNANAVLVSDDKFECNQRSRKLIQDWQQKLMVSKIERKLRTDSPPPPPQSNMNTVMEDAPPPPS
ncbi:hypothetical protein E3N88_42426 [Mikania micrantha]|uniref:Transmembrane protein n=1 Tax=Mikania micrantha TaxID=192012 RepID=A0A5N6LHT5_9ASTR|nr:hypothetical protein E3N88_42426 [Mikania micrantha]